MKTDKKYLTKKSDDISRWYNEIIQKAQLADDAPVKGCMIIMPYGYAIWEKIQHIFDKEIKKDNVQNAYFPVFIPYSYLQKEKQHVAGFSPELAVVTTAGGEELKEPLVVRPTSETIMYQTFAKWISSYKDLPLKINQWCNVVRWEKRTYPFLRTSEFLWQEGHTVHATEEEAMKTVMRALDWYRMVFEDFMGISVYVGEKSVSEKFAGAKRTFAVELVIPNGKALQGATSHNLGQNFARAFGISYLDKANTSCTPFQTSWGLSTRSIGGLILTHGDDNGLILPPNIAPYQIVILPIPGSDKKIATDVHAMIKKITALLTHHDLSFFVDDTDKSIGYRISEAEIKGIPLRIEVGPRDVIKKSVTISRRDTLIKESVLIDRLPEYTQEALSLVQKNLYLRSEENKKNMTADVDSYDEFKEIMTKRRMFIRAYWCESGVCEAKIKEQTKATTRVCELSELEKKDNGRCVYCGNNALRKWLFAQAY